MPSGAAGAAAHAVVTGAAEAEECADAAAAAGGSADGAPADPSLRGLRSALLRQLFGAAAEPAVAAAARQLLDCMNLEEAAKNDPTTALKCARRARPYGMDAWWCRLLRCRTGAAAARVWPEGALASPCRRSHAPLRAVLGPPPPAPAPASSMSPPLPPSCPRDSQRFPEVLRRRRGYGAAQAHLDGLLAGFRRQLQIGNLQFVTLQVGRHAQVSLACLGVH